MRTYSVPVGVVDTVQFRHGHAASRNVDIWEVAHGTRFATLCPMLVTPRRSPRVECETPAYWTRWKTRHEGVISRCNAHGLFINTSLELDVGFRLSRSYTVFLLWERAQLGSGNDETSNGPQDGAESDFWAAGLRASSNPDKLAFLTEVAVGYRRARTFFENALMYAFRFGASWFGSSSSFGRSSFERL